MLCAPLSLVERIRRWWQRHGITKSAAKDCEVDFDKPWEEERLPNFDSTQYYPVKIAERIAGRYEILGKVGFGTSSTVWYCRDRK